MQTLKKALNAALAVFILTTAYGLLNLLTSFSTFTSRLALLILTAGSLILSILLSLILKPLKFETRVKATESSYPTRRHPSDVTILVSVDHIVKAATHTDTMRRDWSFEWQNIVEAAVGPHSTIDVSQVAPEDLQNSAVLVLTKSASASLSHTLTERIEAFMHAGGVVISEGPSLLVTKALGHVFEGQSAGPLRLDFIASEFVPAALTREAIGRRPFCTTLHEASPREGSISGCEKRGLQVLAASSGRPCVVSCSQQKGHLIAFLFEVSTALMVLKQGLYPRNRIAAFLSSLRHGWGWPKPAHFIPRLSDFRNDDPVPPLQEVLADAVFRLAASLRPFAAVSRLPAGKNAFLILTHDEDYAPEELKCAIEEASSAGVPQTAFLLPDCERPDSVQRVIETSETEAAFHWNRFRLHFDRKGVHGSTFTSPESALHALESGFRNKPVISSRIHWLAWDESPGETFRALEGAGVAIDSSQGPIAAAKGYVFATGYGYCPLSPNGSRMALLEVPYEVEDDVASADVDFIAALIERNLATWHSGIVILMHPWECVPNGRLRLVFEETLRIAQRDGVWATTLCQLHAFRSARVKCAVSSTLRNNTLSVRSEVEDHGMSLLLPASSKTLVIQEVTLDGAPASVAVLPGQVVSVAVPRGSHTVKVRYAQGQQRSASDLKPPGNPARA